MAERRSPYAPEYRHPHWSVVGLASYRGVAKYGDITGGRGDACVAPTASFRAGLELSFCGADSWDPAEGRETPWIDLARQLAGDRGVAALATAPLRGAARARTPRGGGLAGKRGVR